MEQLLETVALDMEESNELAFKIKVEGATSPAKVRLVCEAGDVSYMFIGRGTSEDGVVQFIIPQMNEKMNEGVYPARVEVLIENRYFSPVQFQINFKKAVKVVAESCTIVRSHVQSDVAVTVEPIFKQRSQPIVQPIVVDRQLEQATAAPSHPITLKERYESRPVRASNSVGSKSSIGVKVKR